MSSTIDAVLAHQDALLNEVDSLAGIDRWFADVVADAARQDGVGGCPIGSLARQLAEHDEVTRAAFVNAFERWQAPLSAAWPSKALAPRFLPPSHGTPPCPPHRGNPGRSADWAIS